MADCGFALLAYREKRRMLVRFCDFSPAFHKSGHHARKSGNPWMRRAGCEEIRETHIRCRVSPHSHWYAPCIAIPPWEVTNDLPHDSAPHFSGGVTHWRRSFDRGCRPASSARRKEINHVVSAESLCIGCRFWSFNSRDADPDSMGLE